MAALHCPLLSGEARSLPPAPAAEGRDKPAREAQPCVRYQPQELVIVSGEVTGDVDVNGREIHTRCPQALSKEAHRNVQHSSPSELAVSKRCGYPRSSVIAPALEQGRGFLLVN